MVWELYVEGFLENRNRKVVHLVIIIEGVQVWRGVEMFSDPSRARCTVYCVLFMAHCHKCPLLQLMIRQQEGHVDSSAEW